MLCAGPASEISWKCRLRSTHGLFCFAGILLSGLLSYLVSLTIYMNIVSTNFNSKTVFALYTLTCKAKWQQTGKSLGGFILFFEIPKSHYLYSLESITVFAFYTRFSLYSSYLYSSKWRISYIFSVHFKCLHAHPWEFHFCSSICGSSTQ